MSARFGSTLPVRLIGIMQGRLLPPTDGRIQCFPRQNWGDEFAHAARAQVDSIEWIYDEYGADVNPLATDEGIESILELVDEHGVQVTSVCADYFMERPLVRTNGTTLDERLGILLWLLKRCGRLGATRIVLPFVDASRIETADDLTQAISVIEQASNHAEDLGIELHVETSLAPEGFAEFLSRLPSECVKVNYDSGNSASLGFDPREEFSAYGPRIGSVHIKDRVQGGGTVPLGTGDADLPAVFECLREIDYSGDVIMQVARDVDGDELAWAERNKATTIALIADAARDA